MKEGRRAGGITAGPESKVLEGLTWEEARHLQVTSCHETTNKQIKAFDESNYYSLKNSFFFKDINLALFLH